MADWSDLPTGFPIRPVGVWPGIPTVSRRSSPFSAKLSATLRDLGVELRALYAKDIVLRIDIREGDLRVDGRPRMNARALSPAIILNLQAWVPGAGDGGKAGWMPLEYACDTYWRWEDNLRAITLTMNALRAVDRYGVTKAAEQYRGFRALPPGGTTLSGAGAMTRDQAVAFLADHTSFRTADIEAMQETARQAWLTAAKTMHPDTAGGDEHLFKRLVAAKEALGV